MKVKKILAFLTGILSGFASANSIEITAQKVITEEGSKVKTYIGNVRVFVPNSSQLATKASIMKSVNGKTSLEGNVVLSSPNAVGKTDSATYVITKGGVEAYMNKVTFTFR